MLPIVELLKLISVKPAQRESDGQADSNRDEEAGVGWTGYLVRVGWFYGTPSLPQYWETWGRIMFHGSLILVAKWQ